MSDENLWADLFLKAREMGEQFRGETLFYLLGSIDGVMGDEGMTTEELEALFSRAIDYGAFCAKVVQEEASTDWHSDPDETSFMATPFDEDNTYYDGFGDHWR